MELFRTNEETGELEIRKFYGYKEPPQANEIWEDFLKGENNSCKELALKYNSTENKISHFLSKKFSEKKI